MVAQKSQGDVPFDSYRFVSWDESKGPKPVREGYMDFRGLSTYYRIVGEAQDGKAPLVLLHGGPGAAHNYMETLDPLAASGREIIYYDQVGCGRSQAPGHTELFCLDVWVEELDALRRHLGLKEMFLLGHSCGGMLLLEYLRQKGFDGIRGIVLASTLYSTDVWTAEQQRLIRKFPQEMQDAIRVAEETGQYCGEAYLAAEAEYMIRHSGPRWGAGDPACLTAGRGTGTEAYNTGWGPNEFTALGNMKDYDVTEFLPQICVPTLITSGIDDMCTPYVAKSMQDAIPGARWELFMHSRHSVHNEENEKYIRVLDQWMQQSES